MLTFLDSGTAGMRVGCSAIALVCSFANETGGLAAFESLMHMRLTSSHGPTVKAWECLKRLRPRVSTLVGATHMKVYIVGPFQVIGVKHHSKWEFRATCNLFDSAVLFRY